MNKYDYKKQYQAFKNIKASDKLKSRLLQIPAQEAKKPDARRAIIIVGSTAAAVLAIVLIACMISFSRSTSMEYEKSVLAAPVSENLPVKTDDKNESAAIQTFSHDQSGQDDVSFAETAQPATDEKTKKIQNEPAEITIQNSDVQENINGGIYSADNTNTDTDIYIPVNAIPVIRVASDEAVYEAETADYVQSDLEGTLEETEETVSVEEPAVEIPEPGKDQGEHLQLEGETFWWGVYDPTALTDKELNQQLETNYLEHPGKDHVWEHIISGNEEWDHCILCGINTNFGFLEEDLVFTDE